ncbi:hypothetical protein [Ascidiimonas aurantiaca]|uniref:hypothetical protein n=1 Tax=Ascidiimonas aurantiaca TaxID=1685432 RepID=UPI0030ED91B6
MKKQEFKNLVFNKTSISRLAQKEIHGGNGPEDSNLSGCCTACFDEQGLCIFCFPNQP